MTELNLMNRDELIKLAALDVFGLLDQYESEIYNKSFHNAPAAVQDEIIALQAAIASDHAFFPSATPDDSLREKVLERVAKAVEDEVLKLAPIGRIGKGRENALSLEDDTRHRRTVRSSRFWRAASFVLAASLMVTLGMLAFVYQSAERIATVAIAKNTAEELTALIGDGLEQFASNPNVEKAALYPTKELARSGYSATFYVNPQTGQAFLETRGLPANAEFTLCTVDEDGEPDTVLSVFKTLTPVYHGLRLEAIDLASIANATIGVLDENGSIIMTTSLA